MLDKVLKAWECCNPFNRRCSECPYEDDCFHDNFDRVAIADMVKLLKDQKERIAVLEEEAKTKSTPQKVLNRKELADLIVGECPLCGALFNNEICPTSCGWCGCLLDWKNGEQE